MGQESWASSPATRKSMLGNKGRDTKPEVAVRKLLHAAGLRYRVSAKPEPDLRRTADILFTRKRIAIFIDGCYWHGCPEHGTTARTNADYWDAKITRNRERDAETDRLLVGAGWTVVRAWEHAAPRDVVDKIIAAVR